MRCVDSRVEDLLRSYFVYFWKGFLLSTRTLCFIRSEIIVLSWSCSSLRVFSNLVSFGRLRRECSFSDAATWSQCDTWGKVYSHRYWREFWIPKSLRTRKAAECLVSQNSTFWVFFVDADAENVSLWWNIRTTQASESSTKLTSALWWLIS